MPLKDLIPPLESLVQSRVQSLQTLAMADTTEGSKGQVEKELIILASLCHHIYPTLQSGEQHPVSCQDHIKGFLIKWFNHIKGFLVLDQRG